ncbi:MAG: O-antigen ligase family protein [Kiritimatiellaceae bacterium]|nr:O-antigen ligase family protein [Kiritimatiellaceae bacterium]
MTIEKSAGWSLLGLLSYTAWARSGIYGPWHFPLWILFALFAVCSGACLVQVDRTVRRQFFTDPLLLIGFLFSVLLLIQWLNAGGTPFINIFTGQYNYTAPPLEGWPFSIEARLSRQQLAWFVPAALFLPVVRHLFSRPQCKWLLRGMVVNAAALALFGLIQYSLGWTEMFGFIPVTSNPHLIATFGYPNHGGTFFYLLFAASIGLLWDAVEKKKSIPQRILLGLLVGLFAITSLCSLSRAAVLAVIVIPLWALLIWVFQMRANFSISQWVNTALLGGVILITLTVGIVRVGEGGLLREFDGDSSIYSEMNGYSELRGFQIPPAWEMVKAHPWFGVGGWGYRYFVRAYLPKDQWERVEQTGKANVHCDPIQFLAEHGWVGFSLLAAGLGFVLAPWRRFTHWHFKGRAVMIAFGCFLVFLHSLIDLPFRNPTVLWHWLLLLVIVPMLSEVKQNLVET